MNDEPYDVLTGHVYDGIQEYDNPTPGWWNWIFAGSVFFAAGYWLIFHIGTVGASIHQAYDAAVAENLKRQYAEIGMLEPTRATMVKYMHDEKWLKVGKIVFSTNCVSCHGANAQGLIGPNLRDDYWKHVKNIEDIPHVVANGAANGAMPTWKNRLHPNDIILVAAYVASLRDTEVPGNKRPPEGEKIPPWPQPKPQPAAPPPAKK